MDLPPVLGRGRSETLDTRGLVSRSALALPPSVGPQSQEHKYKPQQQQRKKTVLGRLTAMAVDAAVNNESSGVDERQVAPDREAGAATTTRQHRNGDTSSSAALGPSGTPLLLSPSSTLPLSSRLLPSPLVSSPPVVSFSEVPPPEVRRGSTMKDLNLYLTETNASLIKHAAASTGEGVAGVSPTQTARTALTPNPQPC